MSPTGYQTAPSRDATVILCHCEVFVKCVFFDTIYRMIHTERVALIILDGWGIGFDREHNAIAQASTEYVDYLTATYPSGRVHANGAYVGLPWNQLSGSEVGHTTIGAGRPVLQHVVEVSRAVSDESFFSNPALTDACRYAKTHDSALHLVGLLSDAGVHAAYTHVYALLEKAKREEVSDVYVHVFLDGRDSPPQSARTFLSALELQMKLIGVGTIASICGRSVAMDRNHDWNKTELAYDLLTEGDGSEFDTWERCIDYYYESGVYDEFIPPSKLGSFTPIAGHDSVVFFNIRSDRMRQLASLFAFPEKIKTNKELSPVPDVRLTSMIRYDADFRNVHVAFHGQPVEETFGSVLADHGKTQLRASETEKYPHVTYFLNNGRNDPYPKERRIIIESPDVSSYAEQPEMNAPALTDAVMQSVVSDPPDVIVMNYPNTDMVGHTGDFEAAKQAAYAVSVELSRLIPVLQSAGYGIVITADHGNAEDMYDEEHDATHTAHTFNDVLGVFVPPEHIDVSRYEFRDGASLQDIAPTLLRMLNIPVPSTMTGSDMIVEKR